MRVLIVDISGKVAYYDMSLYDSILKEQGEFQVTTDLLIPGRGLLSLIPSKYANSTSLIKRAIKAVEGILNYLYVCVLTCVNKYSIIHFEWLPFLEISKVEVLILKIIRHLLPETKLLLTIHNVYPHNISEDEKRRYKRRFIEASKLIDGFIVHTLTSKSDVIKQFDLAENDIYVVCHGVFTPSVSFPVDESSSSKPLRILLFGSQSFYKGTDILVSAVNMLPKDYMNTVEVLIEGGISPKFFHTCQSLDTNRRVKWKPYFVSNEELYDDIINSDIIVLPYRAISQSGALLLAIYFEKCIVMSDLPSFVETMCGFDEDIFFETDNPNSLSELLLRYISGNIDSMRIRNQVKIVKSSNSWSQSAKQTLSTYLSLIK